MIGTTPDQTGYGLVAADVPARRYASGRWSRLACAWLGAAVLACGGGGAGGDSPSDGGGDPPLATELVNLPPGKTVADLAWTPSEGFISSYLVFVSRNHGSFDFNQLVTSPTAEIPGAPGDEIRITVVAASLEGDLSAASPPSVEIRFRAAAALALAASNPTHSILIAGSAGEGNESDDVTPVVDEAPTTPDDTPASDSDGSDGDSDNEQTGGQPASQDRLTRAARERLLLADVRLPLSARQSPTGGIDTGAAWLEARVESELSAGVTLVGTAERAEGAFRDLVWRDTNGQLSVSDGEAVLDAAEMASTLVPAIRLGETERFVALADVDGDGLREWITEETTTGAAWIRTDDATPPRSARAAHQTATARLIGSGEFDGAGAAELLWQNEDGSLDIERPAGAGSEILLGALPPLGTELVAIADLNGDGRDDLIARGEDGRLALGETVIDGQTGGFWIEWSEGPAETDASVPLVATLDLDLDGRAELAWLVGDSVEVRAVGETTPQAFEF